MLKRVKPTVVRLWSAIKKQSNKNNIHIDFTYDKNTDKIEVTAMDKETCRAITEKYLFDDLASMSQSQLDAVIADLVRFIDEGGGYNIWE